MAFETGDRIRQSYTSQPIQAAKTHVGIAVVTAKDLPIDIRVWWYVRFLLHWLTIRRLFHLLLRLLTFPKRLTIRVFDWYPKLRSFVSAISSRSVGNDEYIERMRICKDCKYKDGDYCKVCNCGKWKLARLTFKNSLSRWYCPAKKHPQTAYPKHHDLFNQMKRSGCTNCGAGNQGKKAV